MKRKQPRKRNYAFIDSQNVNLSIEHQGWKLDWKRLRQYLKDKLNVEKAFLFIGYMQEYQELYTALQSYGYILIFKPILKYKTGKIKGNVDAEMVLQTMIEYPKYEKAILVTGDGDFHCLIKYLSDKNKLERLLIPNKEKFSALLRKFTDNAVYLTDLKNKLKLDKRKKTVA